MNIVYCSHLLLLLLVAPWRATLADGENLEELSDFNFQEENTAAGDYFEDINEGTEAQSEVSNDFDPNLIEDLDGEDGDEVSFAAKEQKVKQILVKALTNGELRQKFSEVMPLLRMMTRAQRVTLAALIQAQVHAKDGRSRLTIERVNEMFGNRPDLILPLVLDIANLIRAAADKEKYLKGEAVATAATMRFGENEALPSAQFLRRSFQEEPTGDEEDDETIGTVVMMDNPMALAQTDERIKVELKQPDTTQGRALITRINSLEDRDLLLSYHERKFNMTAFNSTPAHADQLAVASDGPIPVKLPRSGERNLTMEEIEDLALSSLNGTYPIPEPPTNDSFPIAEQLIGGRFDANGKGNKKRRPGLLEENCEKFSGSVCLTVNNYPIEQIMGSIRRHKYALPALLAEYSDTQDESISNEYDDDPELYDKFFIKRQDSASSETFPGHMCESIVRYARPQKARSASGDWKYIVNTGVHTQTIRLEKCSKPDDTCSFLSENYRSRCIQVFNYHRLLSWDSFRGLHVDIFKVPSCCMCHVDGYKEVYPPHQHQTGTPFAFVEDDGHLQQASSQLNAYSTLRDIEDVVENDDYDSIAYQFSDGFKRKKPFKVATPTSTSRNRFDRPKIKLGLGNFIPSPTLESYLSPPMVKYEPTFSFKPRVPPTARRRPQSQLGNIRKHTLDQLVAASDQRVNEVTVLPPHSPTRVTTPSLNATMNIKLPNSASSSRVNYNYHPIIDFFAGQTKKPAEKPTAAAAAAVASSERQQSVWRPLLANNRRG